MATPPWAPPSPNGAFELIDPVRDGVYRSGDGGRTWRDTNRTLPAADYFDLAADPDEPTPPGSSMAPRRVRPASTTRAGRRPLARPHGSRGLLHRRGRARRRGLRRRLRHLRPQRRPGTHLAVRDRQPGAPTPAPARSPAITSIPACSTPRSKARPRDRHLGDRGRRRDLREGLELIRFVPLPIVAPARVARAHALAPHERLGSDAIGRSPSRRPARIHAASGAGTSGPALLEERGEGQTAPAPERAP
jgi:hypothetical protein